MLSQFVIPQLTLAYPEIFLTLMACVLLLLGLHPKLKSMTFAFTLLSLAVTFYLSFYCSNTTEIHSSTTFNGLYIVDSLARVLKIALCGTVILALLLSRREIVARKIAESEFYVVALFATVGMMTMISANHFVTVYVGLELLSLSLYSMIAMNRDCALSTEAAMKYFILGAVASGMLLFGFSMLYGVTGTLDINVLAIRLQHSVSGVQYLAMVFGLVFMVAGMAFKLGAVPFHMWVPDIYQGSYSAVTIFIATAPKLAAFAMLIRLFGVAFASLNADWQSMFILLAVLSMGIGNLLAIAQQNFKRVLAYSAISHMGFMLLGLVSGVVGQSYVLQSSAYAASLTYILVYVLMSLGCFGMLFALSSNSIAVENISDFKGLNQKNPWLAAMMLMLMFSMAGVPFFVGFFAKFAVISAVVKAGHISLAVAAVFFSLIGAFYYLRIVKVMYFDAAEPAVVGSGLGSGSGNGAELVDDSSSVVRMLVSVIALLVAAFGLFPQPLFNLANSVMHATLFSY